MTPPTSLGYTATPAYANLDALPQLAGLLTPMLPTGHRTTTSLQQYLDRNKLVNSKEYLVGDGVANDNAKLVDMQTDAGASGTLDLFPGTPKIDAGGTVTISQHVKPRRGFMFRPAAGTQLLFTGPIDYVDFQWIDYSLGGTASAVGNRYVSSFNPRWTGVVGDNATLDTTALQNLFALAPDFASIEGPGNLQCLVNNLTLSNRTGLRFKSGGWPFDSGGGPAYASPQLRYSGADGGTLFSHLNNGQVVFEGWVFDVQNAAVGVEMTKTAVGATRISTNNAMLRCTILGGFLAGTVAVRVGHNAPGNCELNRFDDTHWFGQVNVGNLTLLMNGRGGTSGGRIAAGTNVITNLAFDPTSVNVPGANRPLVVGMRIRVAFAGATNAGPNAFNGMLDTTITALGANSITLAANAVHNVWVPWVTATNYVVGDVITSAGSVYYCYANNVSAATTQPGVGATWQTVWTLLKGTNLAGNISGPYMVAGQGIGTGLLIENQNSHWQRVYNCDFHAFLIAIENISGSHVLWMCNFGDNEIDVAITNNSMQCAEYLTNTENSLKHYAVTGNGKTYLMEGGRQSNGYCLPSDGWLDPRGTQLVARNIFFDNQMAFGSTLWNMSGGGVSRSLSCSFGGDGAGGLTTQELGWLPNPSSTFGHGAAVLWEAGGADSVPIDGSASGRVRKWYVIDGWLGDAVGEQFGPGYMYQPAIVGPAGNTPDNANLDPAYYTTYRTHERGPIRRRLKNLLGELVEFEDRPFWKYLLKTADYNVAETDFGTVVEVDCTAGPVTIGVQYFWESYALRVVKIDATANALNVNWGGGVTYNGKTALTTTTQGDGWEFRGHATANKYTSAKLAA